MKQQQELVSVCRPFGTTRPTSDYNERLIPCIRLYLTNISQWVCASVLPSFCSGERERKRERERVSLIVRCGRLNKCSHTRICLGYFQQWSLSLSKPGRHLAFLCKDGSIFIIIITLPPLLLLRRAVRPSPRFPSDASWRFRWWLVCRPSRLSQPRYSPMPLHVFSFALRGGLLRLFFSSPWPYR